MSVEIPSTCPADHGESEPWRLEIISSPVRGWRVTCGCGWRGPWSPHSSAHAVALWERSPSALRAEVAELREALYQQKLLTQAAEEGRTKALAWADSEITATRASEARMLKRLEEAQAGLAAAAIAPAPEHPCGCYCPRCDSHACFCACNTHPRAQP